MKADTWIITWLLLFMLVGGIIVAHTATHVPAEMDRPLPTRLG